MDLLTYSYSLITLGVIGCIAIVFGTMLDIIGFKRSWTVTYAGIIACMTAMAMLVRMVYPAL